MQYRTCVTLILGAQLGAQADTMAFRVGIPAKWADMPQTRLLKAERNATCCCLRGGPGSKNPPQVHVFGLFSSALRAV